MLLLQLPLTTAALRLPRNYSSFHSINACSTAGAGKRTLILPKSRLDGPSSDAVQGRAEVMPKHVAIIMDGNGRWAKNRNLPVGDGHRAGCQTLTPLISKCCDLRINTLTIFAFSNDNWKRSQSTVCSAEEMSEANKGMHLVLAVSYSGRDDVVQAAKKIATKVENEILRASDIDETMFEQQLMTNILDFPDPDLLMRTSGELRISNFLLWQSAYTEFYFSDKLFPDFCEAHLLEAFASYQCRQRRYGQRRN